MSDPKGLALRHLLLHGAAVLAVLAVAGAYFWLGRSEPRPLADPENAAQVAEGEALYAQHCASCHGAALQGEPNWRQRKPDGKLPAPPHDATGHSWHHPDAQLFALTKQGLGPFAPPGYESDMPAFAGVLSDEQIWAVLAYIKSRWPEQIRRQQATISARAGN